MSLIVLSSELQDRADKLDRLNNLQSTIRWLSRLPVYPLKEIVGEPTDEQLKALLRSVMTAAAPSS
jgi:hypothetical protein